MPIRSRAPRILRIAATAITLAALSAVGAGAQTSPGLNLDALVGKTPQLSRGELGVNVLTGGTPKLADLAFGQGLAHMKKGDIVKAIDTLRLAAAGRPSNAAFRAVLGDAYLAAGTPDAVVVALDQFQTAVRLDPSAVHAREGLAEAAWLTGDVDAAIGNLEKLYLGDGKALREHYAGRLATRYILARQIDRGIVTFARAYPRSSKPSAVLLLLATLSMQKQDKENARALVEKVLAAEPAGSTLALQAKHMLEQGIGP